MKQTRRDFLSFSTAAVGAAALAPSAFAQLSAVRGLRSSALLGLADSPWYGKSVPAKIHIDAGEPVRTMRGGIGASFHVVSKVLPTKKPGRGDSWSGSEYDGNPEPEDTKHWDDLFRYAEWLGLDWCRVEFEQSVYEPERRRFDWDGSQMRVMYKVLDWAESRGVDVFLTQMWADVAWNSFAENAGDPVRTLRSAPKEMNEWAFGLGELIEHLTKVKKYTCLRWLVICNEPEQDEFSWWQDANMKAMPITPGLKAARAELDRRGLALPLSGPDWPFLPAFDPSKVNFDQYVGAIDFHSYDAVFDSMGGGTKLSEAEKYLAGWAKWAHDRNKALFLSELGTMGYGWGHDDLAPASYESGLKNASLVVRAINAGVDGFNRWSFTNRGDLDGAWQLVRTWDIEDNKLLDVFAPQPNAFYQYGMLTRFFPKHSGVLATKVDAPFEPEDRKLVATALRSPKGGTTILVVNENYHPVDVTIDLNDMTRPTKLQRYAFTTAERDKVNVEIKPERTFEVSGTLTDHIEPTSIVVYSTYNLNSSGPGLISE